MVATRSSAVVSLLRESDEQNADLSELVLTADNEDETTIRIIEFYTDAGAFGRTMKSAEVGAMIEQSQPLLSAPLSIVHSANVASGRPR